MCVRQVLKRAEKVTVAPDGTNRRSIRELNISVTAGARPDYLPSPACGEPPTSVMTATWCCQLQHSDLLVGERRAELVILEHSCTPDLISFDASGFFPGASC